MATIQAEDIGDLIKVTLKDLGRLRFNLISQKFQSYEVANRIMRRDKVEIDSGTAIQRNVMTGTSGAAKMTGLHGQDTTNVPDLMNTISVPWRHTTTNWSVDERVIKMNSGAAKIVDYITTQRIGSMLSLIELMEDVFWTKPADSNDNLEVFGVPYWIVKNATVGFNGGDPSGFSSGAGGLATATYPKWKNYTGQYTAVTKADLITKMRKGYRKVQFKAPLSVPDYRHGNGDQYRIYVNDTTIVALEDLGEAQNENLGRDLAPMDDQMAFRRNPVIWVPKLDEDTTDPVYGINWGTFYPHFLKGEYLNESGPMKWPNQHRTNTMFVDLTWNMCCDDRRRNFVFHK